MNKLMLGGGYETPRYRRLGWTILDGEPARAPDIVALVPPFPDEVTSKLWNVVAAVHVIEHFYREDALRLVSEIFEILIERGSLILEQADITYVCRVVTGEIVPPVSKYPWMKGDPSWFGLRNMYPQPDQIGDNDLNHHRYAYSPETLTDLVVEAGFDEAKVSIKPSFSHVLERDFRLEAVK